MGKPIVMGRKTFDSIGKALPGRPNIVLTRDACWRVEGVHVAHCVTDAMAQAASLAPDGEEIMVIGGAQIYRLALPHAGRLYITEVRGQPDGDAWFPEFDRAAWRETHRQANPADAKNDCDYSFVTLERLV